MEDFREVKKRDFIYISLWNLHSPLSVSGRSYFYCLCIHTKEVRKEKG